ncbi:MAG: glycine--tRNA ligase subunit beta, partial [Acidobacteriota bacterium]
MSSEPLHEYFLEILAEEIPAWMLPPPALERELRAIMEAIGAGGEGTIRLGATPRRIWFQLAGLPRKQKDREEEVKGPPRKIAFAEDGSPSPALAGFLKKNGATISDVISGEDDYIRIRRTVSGLQTTDILTDRVPKVLEGIRWPKMMRWGDGSHSWIR